MNNSREDIFEQVRLLLYGYQKADLLCYRVKSSWKEGQSPNLWPSLLPHRSLGNQLTAKGYLGILGQKPRRADYVKESLRKSQGPLLILTPGAAQGGDISLSLGRHGWTLASDAPLSKLHLEGLRTP